MEMANGHGAANAIVQAVYAMSRCQGIEKQAALDTLDNFQKSVSGLLLRRLIVY